VASEVVYNRGIIFGTQSDCQGTIIVSLTGRVSISFKLLKIDFF